MSADEQQMVVRHGQIRPSLAPPVATPVGNGDDGIHPFHSQALHTLTSWTLGAEEGGVGGIPSVPTGRAAVNRLLASGKPPRAGGEGAAYPRHCSVNKTRVPRRRAAPEAAWLILNFSLAHSQSFNSPPSPTPLPWPHDPTRDLSRTPYRNPTK